MRQEDWAYLDFALNKRHLHAFNWDLEINLPLLLSFWFEFVLNKTKLFLVFIQFEKQFCYFLL